jgi:hypothetical protein
MTAIHTLPTTAKKTPSQGVVKNEHIKNSLTGYL